MIKSLGAILLVIFTAKTAVTLAELDYFRNQVVQKYDHISSELGFGFGNLENSRKSNIEVTAEMREYINHYFDLKLKTANLETLLVQSIALAAKPNGDEATLSPMTEDEARKAAIEIAKSYKNQGNYKDYSSLRDKIQGLIELYASGYDPKTGYFKSKFLDDFASEIRTQIMEDAMKIQGKSDIQQIIYDNSLISKIQKFNNFYDTYVKEFASSVISTINLIRFAQQNAIKISKQKQPEIDDYRETFQKKLLDSIAALLYSSFLSEDFITADNSDEMVERIIAMINALSRSSEVLKVKPCQSINNLIYDVQLFKKYQMDERKNLNTFLDGAETALNNNKCNIVVV